MSRAGSKGLVLAAMIFAVSMTFIDMTIVSIAIPEIQKELALSSTGVQWVVNGYLLSLAALFALGGRLSDTLGHRKMVFLGVIVFASASTMCGLTPTGGAAEAWMITFRVIQGAGAAIMYPAALAIVVSAYPLRERGRALAVFFAVAGGLTALGPLLGGYLSEWTWRAIFWVNVPVAIIAIVLTIIAKPDDTYEPAKLDIRGAILIAAGMGLSILGLQQSSVWGWSNPATWGCIVGGFVILVLFVVFETKVTSPLIRIAIFRSRAFAVENVVLFISQIVFVPVFFFASMYSQIALGYSASTAGTYLLVFFAGFAPAAQVGGRILDKVGAKPTVIIGNLVAAVGFGLWAWKLTDLSLSSQWYFIVLAGAGIGLMLGPANTDAVNRASRLSYGEATGITQTIRNYGASLGLAVLGTVLITQNRSNIETSLAGFGIPKTQADSIAQSLSQSGGGAPSGFANATSAQTQKIFAAVQGDFAQSCRTVFFIMAGVMAIGFVASFFLPGGRMPDATEAAPTDA
jgi:EmrB/QacA subfamily drug resistance transporter